MSKICIFGGTTEGRKLAEFLSGQPCDVMVCVATDYGQTLLPEAEHVSVSARRLPVGEIARATDINDLMTNTVGTVLGYLLARVVLKFFPGTEPSARTKDVFLVCGMTFGVMFFVQPFLAALVWNWIM